MRCRRRALALHERGFGRGSDGAGWQKNLEARAFSDFAFHVNLAAMRFDNRCDEAQPEAQPFLRIRIGHAIEAIEDMRQVVLRYADTGILYHKPDVRTRRFRTGPYPAACRGVFYRV